jgi:sensor histidine kinase YesM
LFKNVKYQHKLFLTFSFVILIILIVSATIFYYYSTLLIKSNIDEAQKNITEVTKEQLDRMIYDMDNLTKQANSSSLIINSLKCISSSNDNYFDENPRIKDSILDMLYSFTATQPIDGRISIISKYYDYLDYSNSYNSLIISKDEIKKIKRISSLMNSDLYYTVSPPHQDEWSGNSDMVISLDRTLRDNYQVYGVIQVNKSVDEIDNLCTNSDNGKIYLTAIYDNSGKIIYNNFPDSSGIAGLKSDKLYNTSIESNNSGNYEVKSSDSQELYFAYFSKLDNVNWTIVQFEDFSVYNKSINFMRNIVIFTFILAYVVILIFVYVFTSSLTKPIKKLIKSIASVNIQSDNINIARKTTNNEITVLSETTQMMLKEIQITTKNMLESREREMKAHLLALQSQLNPHFLYNTLAVIGAYGQNNGNNIVSRMSSELGNLLRYTVDFNISTTTIEDEFNFIKSYLYIMGMRYQNFLEYEISCEHEMEQIIVPKLILQPLVENCFKHGLIDIEPKWKVNVKGYIRSNFWYIEVVDNGKGFDEQKIEELYKRAEDAKKNIEISEVSADIKTGGLGLINTIIRLHIFYSGAEFFKIEQGEGKPIIIGGPIDERKI